MSGHDRAHPGRDRGPERDELDLLQPLPRNLEHRERPVGVYACVAVPRKMLHGRDDAARLDASNERRDVPGHLLRVLAEAPDIDDRVVRVDVDVGDGRVDLVETDRPRLLAEDLSLPARQLRVARGGDRHRPGPVGRVGKTHPDSGLEVRADEQRHPRGLLQPAGQEGALEDVRPRGPVDPAHVVLTDLAKELQVLRGPLVHERARRDTDEELPDLLVEAHRGRRDGDRRAAGQGCAEDYDAGASQAGTVYLRDPDTILLEASWHN